MCPFQRLPPGGRHGNYRDWTCIAVDVLDGIIKSKLFDTI